MLNDTFKSKLIHPYFNVIKDLCSQYETPTTIENSLHDVYLKIDQEIISNIYYQISEKLEEDIYDLRYWEKTI